MRSSHFLTLMVAALIPATSLAQADDEATDCLFANDMTRPARCQPDPYGIAREPLVVRMIQGLGLNSDQVQFFGCGRGRFSSRMVDSSSRIFRINYPLNDSYVAGSYVGPTSHELGHIIQLNEAGSRDMVLERLNHDLSRVELGADFLSGRLFRQYLSYREQGRFEHNLDLIGNYAGGSIASHRTPEARTAAFRLGFYDRTVGSMVQAHARFQQDDFAAIVHEIAPDS